MTFFTLVDNFGVPPEKTVSLLDELSKFKAQFRIQPLGAIEMSGGKRFYFLRNLGQGVYGTVLSATESYNCNRATKAIKQFRLRADNEGVFVEDVETEFHVAEVIRRRLGREFATSNVVCAEERFLALPHYGYVVMPYVCANTLGRFLTARLRAKHTELERLMHDAGLSNVSQEQLVHIAERGVEPDASATRAILRLLIQTQHTCYALARQLLVTVALLHAHNIYHSDLKPPNILVDANNHMRLIDFGIAAVGDLESDVAYTGEARHLLLPDAVYTTTAPFEDPLARVSVGQTPDEWNAIYARCDAYAVGKIIQLIFDPTAYSDCDCESPVVRQSLLMPGNVLKLIESLTGQQAALRGRRASTRVRNTPPPSVPRITTTVAARILCSDISSWLDEPAVRYFLSN